MYGIYQLCILIVQRDLTQRQHDVFHRLTVILPAVAGHQNDLLVRIIQLVKLIGGKDIITAHGRLQRVDDSISRHKDPVVDPLAQKICAVVFRGTKVQVGDLRDQLAVHLLRER